MVVPVPPIIERETFDTVQALLKARHPTVTPSAVISGPILLTGLIHCAKCSGAMTIRTGKGGRYRYYACSTKARQGPTGCEGMAVPMEKLDELVATHLEERLLQPERLETILAAVLDRRQERGERQREHIAELNKRATESELRLKRLYDAIEAGVADLNDPALKDRIEGLKAIRDQAKADAERALAIFQHSGSQAVTPQMLSKFARAARQRIRLEGGGYRRDHLRALAQRVEVADGEVRIMGSKSRLLQTLVANGSVNSVPTQVLKWRRERDPSPETIHLAEMLESQYLAPAPWGSFLGSMWGSARAEGMGRAKTGSHLERHGERWRVAVKVPPSLRVKVGKAWLKESLPAGTTARSAETLKWPVVARFKQHLANARAGAVDKGLVADALAYREMLRSEPPAEHEEAVTASELVTTRAEAIEERHGEAAAVAFADIAFGRATPLRSHMQQWFDRKRFSAGYKLDAERALDRLEGWLTREKLPPTAEAVTVEVAARYVHGAFVKAGTHYKTANKDVSCLSSYWRHLAKSLGVKPNPWAEQRLEAPSARHGPRTDKKRPFSDGEVVTLLAGIRSARERDFSLVAALSGMREDEIASLTVGDCRDGVFNVAKSKTPAGVRKVPIHPDLAPLVARLSQGKEPGAYLIGGLPDQREDSKRGRGAPVAQAFTRERRRLGVDERNGEQRQSNVDFHSWRRWFIRKAIQAFEAGAVGFTPWTIARVVGHKAEKGEIDGVALPLGMTMARYPGASSAESMKACVEAVKLPRGTAA